MENEKYYVNSIYIIITACFIMICLHYVQVVKPDLIPINPLTEFLIPIAFDHRVFFRLFFILSVFIGAIVSDNVKKITEKIQENPKLKLTSIIVSLLTAYIISSIEQYPLIMFTILYPLCIVLYVVSSSVYSVLFKFNTDKLKDNFGFKPNWKYIDGPFNLTFYSSKHGYVIVENIFRGIFILGGAGAGKSYSLIEPIIEFVIKKGMTGLIFDFKMGQNFNPNPKEWALTRFTYMKFLEHSDPKTDKRKLYIVNFKDPRYSHRINPIAPEYLPLPGYANEYAITLLTNLEPKWAKDRDFFANSAIVYLKAIIWFLKNDYPNMCTLPHAISIATLPYNKVLAALSLNNECVEMLSSIKVADEKNAEGQLAGVDASLKTPLDKLNSPEIFWVLSGNDFSLRLNDPKTPAILCLGSDPELKETYNPVCALIATVVRKVMNETGKIPSVFMLDEAPQLILDGLDDLPATARSNKIATIICGQTMSQFVKNYGKERAEALVGNLGNHFYGQLNDEKEAETVSKLIGQREKINKSISKSSGEKGGKTKQESYQKDYLIQPYELVSLPRGTFVGKVAETTLDHNKKPLYDPFFYIQPEIKRTIVDHQFPMIAKHPEDPKEFTTEEMMEIMWENFRRIKKEAAILIDRCARNACVAGYAEEERVFPKHFQRIGGQYVRVVSIEGKVMPGVTGIRVEGDLMEVKGKATLTDEYKFNEANVTFE